MGFGAWWHWAIVLLVVLLLFGGGKLSGLMGDAAKGIRAFQKGLKEGEDEHRAPSQPAGTLPRTDAEQDALRQAGADASAAASTPPAQPAEPRA